MKRRDFLKGLLVATATAAVPMTVAASYLKKPEQDIVVKPGEWHHIVMVRTGDTTILYLDGEEVGKTYGGKSLQVSAGTRSLLLTSEDINDGGDYSLSFRFSANGDQNLPISFSTGVRGKPLHIGSVDEGSFSGDIKDFILRAQHNSTDDIQSLHKVASRNEKPWYRQHQSYWRKS